MRKKSASGVLARHCRLTISAAFTSVTRFIQRVVNLRSSPYGHGTRACLGRLGVGGYECVRFAAKTLPAHRLAGVHRPGAPYSSRRGPRCGLAGRSFCASGGDSAADTARKLIVTYYAKNEFFRSLLAVTVSTLSCLPGRGSRHRSPRGLLSAHPAIQANQFPH